MDEIDNIFNKIQENVKNHCGSILPYQIEMTDEEYYFLTREVRERHPGLEIDLIVRRQIFGIHIKIISELIPRRVTFQAQVTSIQDHFQAHFNSIQDTITRRSLPFGYNSLAENPIRPQVFQYKTHPPYPLIGIEWEPQLTLLNYPKKMVEVGFYHRNPEIILPIILEDSFKDRCKLILPGTYKQNVDADNLEFRTNPVKFEDLKSEIERVQNEMEELVKVIAKEVGPTGIFLPGYPCTKHVNISGIPFTGSSERKEYKFGERIHVRVPYSYDDYISMKSWKVFRDVTYTNHNEPIFLGYSMTGGTYVRRSNLI